MWVPGQFRMSVPNLEGVRLRLVAVKRSKNMKAKTVKGKG